MGYRSDFTISADVSMGPFAKRLAEISGYEMKCGRDDTIQADDIKWYDAEEDIAKLSAENPAVKFTIYVNGEDGAKAMIYALDGDVERCDAMPTAFPERTLWSDAK